MLNIFGTNRSKSQTITLINLCFLAAEICGKYVQQNRFFSALQGVSIADDFTTVMVTEPIEEEPLLIVLMRMIVHSFHKYQSASLIVFPSFDPTAMDPVDSVRK
jgi:hypothetical protein